MQDLLKIIAYFNVYGLNLFGLKHKGYDTGKNNLVSYFCVKKGWSENRLKVTIRKLKKAGILKVEPSEGPTILFSLHFISKEQLNLIEL